MYCSDATCSVAPSQKFLASSKEFHALLEVSLPDPQRSHKWDSWGGRKETSADAHFRMTETFATTCSGLNLPPAITTPHPLSISGSLYKHNHWWSKHRAPKPWTYAPIKQQISNTARCLETAFYILTYLRLKAFTSIFIWIIFSNAVYQLTVI